MVLSSTLRMCKLNCAILFRFKLPEIVIIIASDESTENTQSYTNGKQLNVEEKDQRDSFNKEEKMR